MAEQAGKAGVARVLSSLRRRDEPELLDDPGLVLPDLAGNLRDLRFLNRRFGGTASVLGRIKPLLQGYERARLLDVATGSADIPLAALWWAERNGLDLDVVGVDISPEVLEEARRVVGEDGRIRLVQGDARSLPWPDEAFDLVTCSLALHHFAPDDAQQVLAEMWRVSRGAVLVSDLTRGRLAYAGTWLVTRTLARNRLTRHDGPLSVLRAYTPDEMDRLARDAGLQGVTVRRHLPFRMTLTARKRDRRDG